MADGSKSRVTSVLVTLAAISTIAVTAYTFWTAFWKPTTELQATIEYGTYLIDPWTAASMSADSTELRAIISELNAYRITGGKLSAPLEKYAEDEFKVSKYDSVRLSSGVTYGYIKTVISDNGDLGAKDVALRMPYALGSLVTFDDGSKKVFGPSPTIDLGDLKPEQKVTVYSWLVAPPVFFLSTDSGISLTYAGGKGSVEVPGKHNMIYQILTSPPMEIWYALGGFWLLVGCWRLGFRQGRSQSEPEPDSAGANRDSDELRHPGPIDY